MTNPMPRLKIHPEDRPAQIKGAREYFESEAPFWLEIYKRADVYAVIHQERCAAVLSVVDELRIATIRRSRDWLPSGIHRRGPR